MPRTARKPRSRVAPAQPGVTRATDARTGALAPQRARLARLRDAIAERGLDAMLITNQADVRYLSAFSGEATYALVTAERFVLISDFRLAEDMEVARPIAEIVIRTGPFGDALKPMVIGSGAGLDAVGVQAEHLSVSERKTLGKALGSRRLKDTTGVLAELRLVKDDTEIAAIRKAVKVQEAAFNAMLDRIAPGMSELEACALLEYEMKARGSTDPAFDTIVAARANGSKPHHRPGKTKLAKNQPVLVDWGAVVDGYHSDMTRVVSFGGWPKKVEAIYDIVLEAHLAGIAAVKPGVKCHEVDAAAREVIAAAGYAEQFGHSLGHGIGLDIHEGPRLAQLKGRAGAEVERELAPGMVVTIEPGIYLPGVGGVRIEDDVVVTERGSRRLSSLPKDMEWATLR